MGKLNGGLRTLSMLSSLLAFVLSAAMGAVFVLVVNHTHHLFSGSGF